MMGVPIDPEYVARLECATECLSRILSINSKLMVRLADRNHELMLAYIHRSEEMDLLNKQMDDLIELTYQVTDQQKGALRTLCPPN